MILLLELEYENIEAGWGMGSQHQRKAKGENDEALSSLMKILGN